ncbi:MAG: thioredoxin-disulfide reductase [Rickettsiales bacterium]|nr:thioredoxin-disulfide reductase [Rickettsiales bacterium]|tara:strand:+ start:374 stop:1372 length:999 start_codon:yes stop_codon:yes gene_type:complete
MSETFHTKVLIIGSGPAGYTAAIYAARANLKPMMVTGHEQGGQLMITTEVENYPGFADPIQGPWLMEQMKGQAANVGTEIVTDYIQKVDFSKRPFTAIGDSGNTYLAETVVISTGAKARWLGLESEKKFQGFGVSACATCDGFFFRDQEVAVIGGGNSAVEEALFLTNFAKKVTLIHRRDTLRAEKIMQQRLFDNPKVEILWDHVLDEVLGVLPNEAKDGQIPGVTGVRVKSTKDDSLKEINLQGVFVAIGHDPATQIFQGHVKMDEEGYILTNSDSTLTNIDGVYAAGDVKDKTYRQAVTAAGMGCMAALEADKFLAEHGLTIDALKKEAA